MTELVVFDCDGDRWVKDDDGLWYCTTLDLTYGSTWKQLRDSYSPLHPYPEDEGLTVEPGADEGTVKGFIFDGEYGSPYDYDLSVFDEEEWTQNALRSPYYREHFYELPKALADKYAAANKALAEVDAELGMIVHEKRGKIEPVSAASRRGLAPV